VKLEEEDDDLKGRCIHQHIDRGEGIAIEVGEEEVGEKIVGKDIASEKAMVDTPKEFIPKEEATSPMVERCALAGVGTDASGAMRAKDASTT